MSEAEAEKLIRGEVVKNDKGEWCIQFDPRVRLSVELNGKEVWNNERRRS